MNKEREKTILEMLSKKTCNAVGNIHTNNIRNLFSPKGGFQAYPPFYRRKYR